MKHGGDLSCAMMRYGGSLADWLDLSTGINPWPWPIPSSLPHAIWHRLPSVADTDVLIAAARDAYRAPADAAIVPAAGTQSLIQWLPRLAAPGAVAIGARTYVEHALSWASAGHDIVPAEDPARFPEGARHAVLVNPNNPDGRITDRASIARLGAELTRRGGWLVVDESFADLDPQIGVADLCVDLPIIVLRSFGKFYGLAGLRLGFAIAAPAIAARLADALGPWAVSGPAMAIGHTALRDAHWANGMRRHLDMQASLLDTVLESAGLTVVGGTALYRLARHERAHMLHDTLARQRIWARRFADNPDLLRFGLPPDETGLERLAAGLRIKT
jgi:cobalamin biosynthetic protein CobC